MTEEYICYNCGQVSSSQGEAPTCSKCSSEMSAREKPKEGDFLIPLKKRGQNRLFRGFGVP